MVIIFSKNASGNIYEAIIYNEVKNDCQLIFGSSIV